MRDLKRGLTAAVVLAATALAGCGAVDSVRYPYAKESPEKIWADAVEATSKVTSVRLSGFLDKARDPRVDFNVLTAENGTCGGTMTWSTADFDIVITPKAMYLRGSAGSWQQHPDVPREQGIVVAPVLADRWIKVDAAKGPNPHDMCGALAAFLNAGEEGKGSGDDEVEEIENLGLSEAAGVKTVQLQVVDDDSTADVWVAVEEPHYLVKVALEKGKSSSEFVFSDFDFKGEVRVPKEKDVLDLEKLTAEDFTTRSG